MRKKGSKTKPIRVVDDANPRKDQAWFESKVAELKAQLEKLPTDRREQFERELEEQD